jgi:predicted unusual protein kinase regulating ubiquinone biosynthesis (AarF/ABC1/UbiB family)
MALSLKPAHLKRYKDVALLLLRYGREDFARQLDADVAVSAEEAVAADPERAQRLARDLEQLGPTFIKIGQLLSTRADLLPVAYLEALTRLQDDVEPFSFAEVEKTIEEELGARLSRIFAEFQAEPVAAASLGQVHRARLRDGRQVAVKVQRPGIRAQIVDDLDAFEEIAATLDRHRENAEAFPLVRLVEELRRTLLRELDYRLEAQNLKIIGANLAEFPSILVPQPFDDFTSGRVLTMEWVPGRKITALPAVEKPELPGERLADALFQAYLKQVLVDGIFHADPHPGNVLVTDDYRLGLIDLGMIGRVAPTLQEKLLRLVLAVAEGQGDEAAERTLDIAEGSKDFDDGELRRRIADLVGLHQEVAVKDLKIGKVLLELTRTTAESGLRLPPELAMLGKTLLHLDEISRALDPDFDPNAAVRKHSADLVRRRMAGSATPGHLFAALLEAKEFVGKLPGRVNRVLDLVSTNSLRVKVDALDEKELFTGLQKIANRIATGLVLAALIVGAALLMQVRTRFTIFGYPGFAMLCFLGAAAGGVALLLSIVASDRPARAVRGKRRRGSG